MNLSILRSVLLCTALAASIPAWSPAVADSDVIRLSEPVQSSESHETFGAPLPETGPGLSLSQLIENGEKYAGKEIILETRVAKVCRKKGCFFVATEGANSARITFKDYGFFIPTDAGGKPVTLAGTFERKPFSAEQAAHYAEDLGESAPENPPAYEYTIVATAVRLPKS
jgi:hypothetical protein